MDELSYVLYVHTNKINGKFYVGITCQKPTRRWRNGNGYKNNRYFYRAIQKYGWENFKHEILYTNLTKEEAEKKEVNIIKELHSNERDYGYNITKGGEVIGKHSEESKRRMSESQKKKLISKETIERLREAFRGRTHSNETKKKISESQMGSKNSFYGKTHTEEARRKISESVSGEKNGMYGETHSDDVKKKISELKKISHARGKHPRARKVICEGMEFECIKDCAEYYKINYQTMFTWLKNPSRMRHDFIDKGLKYKNKEGG